MPIPLPNLDDRRWADLVEQGRALIPLYSPEWTDHNASDPGITLMELLAWVAEMDVYQVNRITTRQRRRLLHLLNIRPDPPHASTAVAELRIASGTGAISLPAFVEFAGSMLDGTAIALRSVRSIEVVASELRAVQRRDAAGFQNVTGAWTRHDAIAIFGDDPVPGAELYLGFDRPLTAHVWAQMYVVLDGRSASLAERRRLVADKGEHGARRHHSARVAWECLASGGQWVPLETDDSTRSLTLSGAVRLKPTVGMSAKALGQVEQSLFYVRCRFGSGAFDDAPRATRLLLNGVELIESAPVVQTWSVAPGAVVSGTPTPGQRARLYLEMRQGAISKLTIDPVPATGPEVLVLGYVPATPLVAGSLTVEAVLAGTGTGEPGQAITLGRRPLVEDTLRFYSLEGESWREWKRADDFAASTRRSADFLLDPTTGEIAFGDGEQARTPPAGALLLATYDATHGEAATAARVLGFADSPRNRVLVPDPAVAGRLTVGNQIVMEAGVAAETLAHAIGRAIESREARLRAVTIEDIETIALETPGTQIARVSARPGLYPGLDCVSAAGVIGVVVIPTLPLGRPQPSAGLIAEVAARLERRRTIGSRIVVTGPGYVEVAVRARLKAFEGADRKRLRRDVADALDAFFHPIRGGPDRTGWPLGRDVFRAEVMQVIDETPGVDHVIALELLPEGCGATCGNLCLRPTSLVVAGPHEIEVV